MFYVRWRSVCLCFSSIILKIKSIKEQWESHYELRATDERPWWSHLALKQINDKTSPWVCTQLDQLVSILTLSHKANLPLFTKQTCSTLRGLQKASEQLLLRRWHRRLLDQSTRRCASHLKCQLKQVFGAKYIMGYTLINSFSCWHSVVMPASLQVPRTIFAPLLLETHVKFSTWSFDLAVKMVLSHVFF